MLLYRGLYIRSSRNAFNWKMLLYRGLFIRSSKNAFNFKYIYIIIFEESEQRNLRSFSWWNEKEMLEFRCMLTRTTESRAARARISAQETVWGQTCSSLALISSITSYPLREFLFGPASFSLLNALFLSNSIDASQPYNTSKKKIN